MSIYQHFRQEEKDFVDQILGFRDLVENRLTPKLTDFLDPREQFITQSIIGKNGSCQIQFFGGTADSERKRALIYPDFFFPEQEDFQITLFEILYPGKFVDLTHPQVLGSLMGLGLKRAKFGDILIHGERIQFFAAQEVADYIHLHFHQVGRFSITLEEKTLDQVLPLEEKMEELTLTVSSLRLDAVLAQVSRNSRSKTLEMIKEGRGKVNWRLEENPSFPLEQGDVISARGIGRVKILSIGDRTKKEKLRITVGKWK